MPTAKLSDRLKQLVLVLSEDPDEFYRYSKQPAAYLRRRRFPKKVITAITMGSRAVQQLLAGDGECPPVFLVIGVMSFRTSMRKRAERKAKKR